MSFYDEIEIEDMTYHPETSIYTYPCPCGDQFEILLQDLRDGEEVAICPSCSLQIKVIFDAVGLASSECIGFGKLTLATQETLPTEEPTTTSEPIAITA